MKAILASVLALLYFSAANAQVEKTINVPYTSSSSPTYQALLYLPSDYSSSSKSYPLLVFCHGAGEAADGGSGLAGIYNSSGSGGPAYFIEHGGWPSSFTNPVTGAQEQFIVVSPQADTWDMSGDALANVVNYLVKTYRVDVNRIHLTGLSAGGESVVEYVSQLDPLEDPPAVSSDKRTYPAASVVPMSQATNQPIQSWGNIDVADGTPCWGFGDPVNDIHGEFTQDLTTVINTAKSGYARFTTFNTGHGPWGPFYNPSYTENFTWNGVTAKFSIYTWMLANSRGGSTPAPLAANAGIAQTITLPTSQVTLSGSASTGTITSYGWTKLSGPSSGTISSPSAVTTTVTGLVQGVYVFQLKLNGSSVSTVQVTVNAAVVTTPVANAGIAQTITLPINQVTLSGSASTGTITSTSWTKLSGPSSGTISSASALTTTVTGLVQGVYVFQLKLNGTSVSTVQVTVNAAVVTPPVTPVANAGGNQSITLPTSSLTLSGSASTGTITSYAWTKVSGPNTPTIASATSVSTMVSGLIAGTYVFQLSVNGGASTSQATVTVNPVVVVITGKCHGSRKYLSPDPGDSSVYMTTSTTPSTLQFQPGDTIAFKAGTGYGQIELHYITGSAQCPIVITNEGGQAWIKGFFKIYGAKYVHIDGSAGGQQYGLKIQYDPHNITGDFRNGVGLQISERSKVVEINNVFINHTIFGMAIKQSPDCADSLNYPNWIMDSIYIHDNLIRQVGLEGMYIGDTDPDNGPKSGDPRYVIGCHAVLDTIYPRPIRSGHMRIYNNIIDSTERGGIQLSGHSDSVALIYGNTVMHNGMDGDVQQGTGISLGMYTKAYVHDNIVKNNTTWGIASLGGSGTGVPLRIEHNTLDSIGYGKHYNNVTDVIFPITPTTPMYSGTSGTPSGADYSFANPIFIKTVTNMDGDSTVFWIKNNLLGISLAEKLKSFPSDSSAVQVFDYAATPMMQKVGSQVCGNVRMNGITPASVYIDAGIKYSTSCTVTPPGTPVANAGAAQTITLPVNSVTLNGSASTGTITSWSWTESSGPSSGTITSPSSVSTTITNLVQGVYIFQLTLNGSVNSTVQVTVNPIVIVVTPPPPTQTGTVSKFIEVNVYGGVNPYTNTQWNNWDVNSLVTSNTLYYTDGTSSGITATLSLNESVVDNSSTYGGTMAPAEVLRYTSYGEGSRTLTISGLQASATYSIELYASRNSNSGNSTVFTIGQTSTSIVTYDNLANKAAFSNLTADGQGNIVVTISTPNSYNYLNGFVITETTSGTTSAAENSQTTVNAAISTLDSVKIPNSPSIAVYPNPVSDNFILQLNNPYRGNMQVSIVDQSGAIRHSFLFKKDQQTSTITLSANDLTAGVYFITVQMGNQRETKKILKL
jgi:hypothetical protein